MYSPYSSHYLDLVSIADRSWLYSSIWFNQAFKFVTYGITLTPGSRECIKCLAKMGMNYHRTHQSNN